MARRLSRWFYYGKLRPLGRIGYNLTIAIELAWHRFTDLGKTSKMDSPDDITAVIKTFERPKILKRLIRSIRHFYPQLKIVVADDSRKPVTSPGVQPVTLPYDSGVSAGRNAALKVVNTKYVLMLDDDFVFFRNTVLAPARELMERYPEIHILGGKVINLPFYTSTDYRQAELFPNDAKPLKTPGSRIGAAEVMDKVANFYLARTESIRKVGWDEQLKRLDHADFFTRARGKLLTAYYPQMQILHAQNLFDDKYQRLRENDTADRKVLYQRYYTNRLDKDGLLDQ
jgi:GT2 family glycosyltransferase